MIEITNLHAMTKDGKAILKGLNLTVNAGEIHAIMGPNGAGKSTLAKVISGHPDYEITSGDILMDGQSLLEMDPEDRARLGLFMSFQYPPEISGVSNSEFLRYAYNAVLKARNEDEMSVEQFSTYLTTKMLEVEMRKEFTERNVNEGFSGGEKKRNEVLQLAVLNPMMAILDETDSGLDIDAIRIVSRGVNRWMSVNKGLILITHYQRLLDYIPPHFVHVMVDGRIVQTGPASLALELEEKGYDHLLAVEEV
ncbi:MAG: Fe-S cluster assembly ATPase SufC [Parachlamydiales bacterium]|nr:Fe-S cluster assembly ATPase SufC [Parachlamydiales bacterium]